MGTSGKHESFPTKQWTEARAILRFFQNQEYHSTSYPFQQLSLQRLIANNITHAQSE